MKGNTPPNKFKGYAGRVNIEIESVVRAIEKRKAHQREKAVTTVMYQEMKWFHVVRVALFPRAIRRYVVINDQPDNNKFAVVLYGKEHWFEYEQIKPKEDGQEKK